MAISAIPQPLIQENKQVNGLGVSSRIQSITGVGGSITVNPTNGSWTRIVSPVANFTVAFTGLPENLATVWYVELKSIGTYSVTWSGVTWDNSTANTGAPNVNARTGRYVVMFYSPDGSSVYGKVVFSQLNL